MSNTNVDSILNQVGDDGIDLSGQPQTPREFIADTMRAFSKLGAGNESEGETEEPDDSIEALDKIMFALAPGLADPNEDDDTRRYDKMKVEAAEQTLDEIMSAFEAATESLEHDEPVALMLQEINLRRDLDYQMGKLDDVRREILASNGVNIQVYRTLSEIGLGIESSLPPQSMYTRDYSVNGLSATLESVNKAHAAAGVVSALLGLGLVYKIYKWLRSKFGKEGDATSAKVDAAIAKAEKVMDAHSGMVDKLSTQLKDAPVETKFDVLMKFMKDDKEAKALSSKDSKTIISHFEQKFLDSVDGDLVDISTPEGLKDMEERKRVLIEAMAELQTILKTLNNSLTDALKTGNVPSGSARATRTSASFFGRWAGKEAAKERESNKAITPEGIIASAKKVQDILTDNEFRRMDASIVTVMNGAKALHERLTVSGKGLSDAQYAEFNKNINLMKELSRGVQVNHVFLMRVQLKAGKELVKLIKNEENMDRFLKEFSKEAKGPTLDEALAD